MTSSARGRETRERGHAEPVGGGLTVARASFGHGTGLVPVHDERAQIGERLAERAQLPVEHRSNARVVADHRVVEPVVGVRDRGRPLGWDAGREAVVHLLDAAVLEHESGLALLCLRLLELAVPPLELTLHVALPPGEVAEPHGVDVDRMEVDEHVDQVVGDDRALRFVEPGRDVRRRPQDRTVDEVHHVERRAVDCFVGAQTERVRHRHRRVRGGRR